MALVQAEYTIAASQEVGAYHYPAPPKSQQLYDPAAAQQSAYTAPQTYQSNYAASSLVHHSSVIAQKFISPALDNAAFNLALTNQGYTYGNTPAVSAALTATSRSSKTTLQRPASSATPVIGSLNVKLPLPLGVTPLNIAPLPLQAGAPYANIPNSVTSYGTVYPQRKRR